MKVKSQPSTHPTKEILQLLKEIINNLSGILEN